MTHHSSQAKQAEEPTDEINLTGPVSLTGPADYLISLLRSVLWEAKPAEIQGFSFEELFRLAEFHSVANIAWYGIEQLDRQPDEPLKSAWRSVRDRQVVKAFTQQSEFESIIATLTQHRVPVLPVKGSLMRAMYPQADYRTMADLDILAPPERMEQVKELLEGLGYTSEIFDRGNQDVYYKPPVMNIEMHRLLIPDGLSYEHYFANDKVWARAIRSETDPLRFQMNWSDFYIYSTTHYHKHFSQGGSGIRSVMDIHIFLKEHRSDLDDSYITQELGKIGLNEFRLQGEAIAAKWFGDDPTPGAIDDPALAEIETYIKTSGTYGTVTNRVRNTIREERGSRFRYLWKRTFLNSRTMKNQYPILRRVPALLPLCWAYRLLKGVLFKGAKIRDEIILVKDIKNK